MKKTIEQFIFMKPDESEKEGYKILVVNDKYSWEITDDCVLIKSAKLDFHYEIPNRDELAELAINTLIDKQKEIMAKAIKRKTELQIKINKLLLITHEIKETT